MTIDVIRAGMRVIEIPVPLTIGRQEGILPVLCIEGNNLFMLEGRFRGNGTIIRNTYLSDYRSDLLSFLPIYLYNSCCYGCQDMDYSNPTLKERKSP